MPLLHIGDVTADAVRAAGLGRVGLLATAYTMEQPFLTDRLAARGLEVLVPDPVDRAMVHRVIYEELCLGIVREESRAAYQAVIERLVAEGAEGVILGCTEIELLDLAGRRRRAGLPDDPAARRGRGGCRAGVRKAPLPPPLAARAA